jgi:hypothetical protein
LKELFMKTKPTAVAIVTAVCSVAVAGNLVGCNAGINPGTSVISTNQDELNARAGMQLFDKVEDLPDCTATRSKAVAWVKELGDFAECSEGKWKQTDILQTVAQKTEKIRAEKAERESALKAASIGSTSEGAAGNGLGAAPILVQASGPQESDGKIGWHFYRTWMHPRSV